MAITTINDRGDKILSDPLRNFRFKVDFIQAQPFDNRITSNSDNGFSGGFTAVSGLSVITDPIMYREGGYNTTMHKVPGTTRFTDVVLSRGVMYANDQAITWMRGLFAAASGEGLSVDTSGSTNNTANQFRCDVKIELMDHPNTASSNKPRMGFLLKNAWISSLAYTDLDASANQVLLETMVLTHEGLSVVFLDNSGKNIDKGSNPVKF